MKILAIETSAKSVSAAVVEGGVPLASAYQNRGLTHSRTLMPLLDGMLSAAGLKAEDMDLLAVANGPGSFTGLRIGVSAEGAGLGPGKALLRRVHTGRHGPESCSHGGLIVCAMDARRDQVYNALFLAHDGILTRQCPDRAISLAELSEELKNRPEPKFIVGDGAKLCYTYLLEQDIPCRMAPPQLVMQNAVGVALAAEEMSANGQTTTARDLVPVYLRLSQAERERLARGLKITLDQ